MKHLYCLLGLVAGLFSPNLAEAHPHVFVDAAAGFQFDAEGQLVSLRITWTYDAFTSLTLFEILDLDRDGDGRLDDADKAAIVAGETEWAEDYKGDTYLEMDGSDIRLARPLGGSAWMADDRISVTFDLPLVDPLQTGGEIVLKLYDPSYFYAYDVVALQGTSREDCTARIVPFEADVATAALRQQLAALSREETPTQANVGRLFADEVRLTCD